MIVVNLELLRAWKRGEALTLKSNMRTITGLGKSVISISSKSSGSFTGSCGTPFNVRGTSWCHRAAFAHAIDAVPAVGDPLERCGA